MSLPQDALTPVERSPAYARRRLRVELRRLRERLGPALTQRSVGERLGWSPSKLMRIEKGHVRVRQTDLEALLRLYGVEHDPLAAELLGWQRLGRGPASHTASYREVLSKTFADYLDEEEAAATIRAYEPMLIPGPLQTPAYARAALLRFAPLAAAAAAGAGRGDGDAAHIPAEAIDRRVEVRQLRQRLLTERRGLNGVFVVTEAALRLWVGNERGNRELMVEQLEHLRALNRDYDNIDIHVMPESAGLFSPLMLSPFVVLEFDDGELLMLRETLPESEMIREDSVEVSTARDAFEDMKALAAPPESLDAFLDAAIGRIAPA
ncbi:helix-turn-helix domain-containing protein [Dactylosporangium sp. CA-139066]|uniref:helix-turn-helix domain-containing protein n=1 Tax=Dactylosporangium sp. CA-139066 TaxID=3239930 RepID=UPI003D94F256